MKHVLRVINVLATVVILVAFVVLLRTVFTPAGEIPTIMGYGFMRTLTGSMEPAIPVHSFIVVDTDNSQVYQVGDIITFHSSDDALEGSLNTHRIVAVEAAADGTPVYRTKAMPIRSRTPRPYPPPMWWAAWSLSRQAWAWWSRCSPIRCCSSRLS